MWIKNKTTKCIFDIEDESLIARLIANKDNYEETKQPVVKTETAPAVSTPAS